MTKRLIFILAVCLFAAATAAEERPPFVDAMEGDNELVHFPEVLPQDAPDNWLLAHIDVETTGLLPGYHEMIDIGLIMTDLEGNALDSLFLRIMPQHPERTSEGAVAVNAFSVERWKQYNALSQVAAVDSILAFHRAVAGDKDVMMVAYNSHFDAAFLDHLFRSAGKTWREMYYYYILDIPSTFWGQGLRQGVGGSRAGSITDILNVPDEPHIPEEHTGITGAAVNLRLYRAMIKRIH